MSKKLWQITGTNEFGSSKEELKKLRTQLNRDTGVDEKETDSNKWKFRITKGPEHPNYSSRF